MNKESCDCRYPQDQYNGTGRCVLCNKVIPLSMKLNIKVPNIKENKVTKEYQTIIDKDGNYVTIIKNGYKDYQVAHTEVPELFSINATLEGIDKYHHNMLIEEFKRMECKLKVLIIS